MKRRIIFSILWAAAFCAAALLVGMLALGIVGLAGMASLGQTTVVFIGRCWSLFLFGMPVLGVILGLRGLLPGTRRSTQP